MSSSTHIQKFLLDENVRIELYKHLSANFDVAHAPKSTPDFKIASISKKEERILVTNDDDFTDFSKDEVFSVIWLRIHQSDLETLISSFKKLLKECNNFEGRMILLEANKWTDSPLPVEIT